MKNILFIMTGGTIASVDNGQGLEPTDDNFFTPITQQCDCTVQFLSPFNLDSTMVAPKHWAKLATLIDNQHAEVQGVVITHGTDTMAYSATALSFFLKNIDIPVVFTGAQIPLNSPYSDGQENVRLAMEVVVNSQLKGVFVAFGGRVMRGDCCSKIFSDNPIGFESVNEPYVDLKQASVLQGAYQLQLPESQDVLLLKMAPTLTPTIIKKATKLGYKKILIEAYGKGGIPQEFLASIQSAIESGTRVGIVTQCTYDGSDCYIYKVGRELLTTGVYDYKKHTTEYALVDMMFK